MRSTTNVKVGCAGFGMAHKRYYEQFGAVEIQRTFYQVPRVTTAARFCIEAPESFEFTMKAWQLITHDASSPTYERLAKPVPRKAAHRYGSFRPTDEVFEAWEETLEFAEVLRAKVVLFQCPASFRPTDENVSNLAAFFEKARRGTPAFAWEPRGDWPSSVVRRLCKKLGLIHAVDPLAGKPVTEDVCYFRLHGRGGFGYSHIDADLREIRAACPRGASGYVFFNNVTMAEDAERFSRLTGNSRSK